MLSVSEARERILATIFTGRYPDCCNRSCCHSNPGEDIVARTDLPPFDNSAVDGFALHDEDLASPRTLKVVADIRAGETSEMYLQPGQAVRVMTGAALPPGSKCRGHA